MILENLTEFGEEVKHFQVAFSDFLMLFHASSL
jgi:hypothetical protein